VKLGVWAFTLFWVIPVSALVALISVDKISAFFPVLDDYLDKHPYQKEVITAFVPTLLVAILAILVPLLLLLIAKQAHTILTLSRLHDTIMTRYYKFLVCK
jgi:ABC-type antimicrobial peptide transport system permease subunit